MKYKSAKQWLNYRPEGKECVGDLLQDNATTIGAALAGFEAGREGSESPDSNVEKNRELLLRRSVVGVQKYGVTTNKANLTQKEWLQHALEEALDLANYLQAAISQIEKEESTLNKIKDYLLNFASDVPNVGTDSEREYCQAHMDVLNKIKLIELEK